MTDRYTDAARTESYVALAHPYHEGKPCDKVWFTVFLQL